MWLAREVSDAVRSICPMDWIIYYIRFLYITIQSRIVSFRRVSLIVSWLNIMF
jgi:hypothetical protein